MLFTIVRTAKDVHDTDKVYEFLAEYLDGVNVMLVNIIKFKMPLLLVMYFKIFSKIKERGWKCVY